MKTKQKTGLLISDEILQKIQMSKQEFKTEIALMLFQKNKFTLGKASEFAGLHQYQFQKLLAERKIPVHYDVADFQNDLKTIKSL